MADPDILGEETASTLHPRGTGDRFASLYTPLAGDAMALNSAKTGGVTGKKMSEL